MKNRALLLILAAAAGAAAYFAFTGEERLVEGQGWTAALTGPVKLMRADGSTAIASRNAIVKAGDSLFTGAHAHCALKFEDGSIAALGPSTKLSVIQLHKGLTCTLFAAKLKLHAGKILVRAATGSGSQSFTKVATASGTLDGRAAEFAAAVDQERTTRVAVFAGVVNVAAQGKAISLRAGQATLIRTNEAPAQVSQMLDAPLLAAPEQEDRIKTKTIGVEYAKVHGGERYLVELARNPKFTYIVAETCTPETAVELPGPTTDGPYYLRVSALDEAGLLGRPSNVVTLFYEYRTGEGG